MPLRSSKASMVGSLPLKRLYNTIGCSVPPFIKIFSLNEVAVLRS